jgi:hypothetical protein
MRDSLATALQVSDEYVWTWTEKVKWWEIPFGEYYSSVAKGHPMGGRLAEEAFPGIVEQLNWAKNPQVATAKLIEAQHKAGTLQNLVLNGDFEAPPGQALQTPVGAADQQANVDTPGYATWQDDDSKGVFSVDRAGGRGGGSAAKMQNMKNGVFLQRIAVKPGQRLWIQVDVLPQGSTLASLSVKWSRRASTGFSS